MKVAIIGAGIVGLYLAWKLASAGHKVVVFEKKDHIGKEACSGLFSERILDFIPQSEALLQNRIESVVIHFPKKAVKVKFSKPFLLMSHAALDRLVAGLARKAGAEIRLGQSITKFAMPEFDRIVGCDGVHSAVRKSLGLEDPDYRLGIQGFVSQEDRSNYVETWAIEDGFIWRISRGSETEYGIIARPSEAKRLFDGFLKQKHVRIEKPVSGTIPQGLIIPKNDSVTLCGDAAGLTKPWSGGGVVWGLIGANLILKNFPDFLKYRQEIKRYFLPKIALAKMATKTGYFVGFNLPYFLPKNFKIENDFLI